MTLESCLMTVRMDKPQFGHQNTYFNHFSPLRNRAGQPFLGIRITITRAEPAGERKDLKLNSSRRSKVQDLMSEKR